MGAGKSVVARELAAQTNALHVDSDAQIEAREQTRIAELIANRGIIEFRRIETATLREIAEIKENVVLSVGGGAWTKLENRVLLGAFQTVWLNAPFDLCWRRIAASQTVRPLAPTRAAAEQLFAEREAIYRTAKFEVQISEAQTPAEIAQEIRKLTGAARS